MCFVGRSCCGALCVCFLVVGDVVELVVGVVVEVVGVVVLVVVGVVVFVDVVIVVVDVVVVVVVDVVVMVVVGVVEEEGWLRLEGLGEWELVWLGGDMGVTVVSSHRSRC